ncbi:MAG TPA: hypothetical protein VFZ25_03895, partial [Chloroflexota bacterium]|nr:hypothetical protein [Chloroflexota bacterium]
DLAGVEVTSDLPVSEASVPVASADGDLPTVPVPTATFSAAPAQAQASRAPARFRVRLPASVDAASRPPDSPSQSIEPPVSTRLPLVPGVAEPVRTAAVPFELPRHPIGSNGTGPPDAAVADTQPWPGLARATGVAAAETDSRGRSRSAPATPLYRDDAASPAAPINAPDDPNVDDLFDRWAEQLEQAAEQLGIESES